MLVHWIWFAHRHGVSDRMKVALLQHFQDPEDIFFADGEAFDHIENISDEIKSALRDKDLAPAEEILAACAREGIHILTYRDAAYPVRLKNIPDPPVVLYYKGRMPDFDGSPSIGVVGTRKASAYGLAAAKRIGYQLGCCGGIVVSGMASGIDAMAMSGALTAGQITVGILGCGADIVYPLSNRGLFRDVESYGCILSEFAPGTPPNKWNFPRRNRLISGLSCGVLVVEAPEKSGSLITARQAADQGRDVFVVPGNIDMPSFVGSNRLLRDGAIAVSTGWDILSEYQPLYPDKIRKDGILPGAREQEKPLVKVAQKPRIPKGKIAAEEKSCNLDIDKAASAAYSDVNTTKPKLSADEAQIVSALASGERLVDDVIAETGLTTGKMLAALTMLELKGVIRRHPGKRISLK